MITQETSEKKYTEAVSQGHYDIYRGGLSGKHDNVRIYWEDQIRGIMLRPYLGALAKRKKKAGGRVRIVDLGAGSGEALRLLTSSIRSDADLQFHRAKILPYEMIEKYIGLRFEWSYGCPWQSKLQRASKHHFPPSGFFERLPTQR